MNKVLMIGLDGVPPALLLDPAIAGVMPTLTAIRRAGSFDALRSTIPAITVPAWPCGLTSRDPGQLGVYGFRNRADRTYGEMRVASSGSVTATAVWDVLGQAGKRAIVIGMPPGYPPRTISGDWISCFLTPDADSAFTMPPQLKNEVRDLVGEYIFDIEDFRSTDRMTLIGRLNEMVERRWKVARHLASTRDWDLMLLHEIGTDRLHHGFWKDYDVGHPKHDPSSPFKGAFIDFYARLDREIAELIDVARPTTVVLCSDHGCKRMVGGVRVNQWLLDRGYLRLKDVPERAVPFRHENVDWTGTRAWAAGGYYARLWLNVKGREPQGMVAVADVDGLLSEIAQGLEAVPDREGRPMGTRVFRPSAIYRESNGVPPDLMVYFGDLDWRAVATVGGGGWHTLKNDTGPDDANHSEDGFLLLDRPGVDLAGGSITDLGPTLLASLDVTAPASFIGRALVNGAA